MAALTTVTWIFALLLTAAGAHKLARPASAGAALAVARLPSDHRLVRLLGASEVVLGLAVVLHGGRPAIAALAVTYAAFAVFAERQRRRGAGCGCFAEADTPATGLHVALNAVAALTAAGAAVAPAGPLPAAVRADPLMGVSAGFLLVLAAIAVRLLLTVVPELTSAVALVRSRGDG